MSDDKMREAFEAWVAKDGGDLSKFGSGQHVHYSNSAVNNAWTGWKAAAQASPVDAPTDAERYAFLRDNACPVGGMFEVLTMDSPPVHLYGERMSGAIDAAMRATPADGGEG